MTKNENDSFLCCDQDAGEDCVQEDDGKTEKAAKRKRKSSHNMKIDEGFEVESVAKHIKQKPKKMKGRCR